MYAGQICKAAQSDGTCDRLLELSKSDQIKLHG